MGLVDVVDDISQRIDQVGGYLPTDVYDAIRNRAKEQFITVINGGQKGNQTAEQIAAGQFGVSQPVASASGALASMNALSGGQVMIGGIGIPVIPLLLVAVGAFIILKKRRG